jgi:hypothetical protein
MQLQQNAEELHHGRVLEVGDHGSRFAPFAASREIQGITRRREAAKSR